MLTIEPNTIAAAIIFIWSLWCILCPSVNDGIVGKLIFIFTALASFALATDPHGCNNASANNALNWSLAMLGARQMAMRYVWPKVRARFVGEMFNRRAGDL